jgi:hypothetical protein
MLPDLSLIPGKSYRGPLEPLSDVETELAQGLKKHVQVLAGDIGCRNLQSNPWNLERAAQYIEDSLKLLEYEATTQKFDVDLNNYWFPGIASGANHPQAVVQTRNIIAELPAATGGGKQIIVLGAHYDSVDDCPAANDNGSGVAALLELARLFKGKELSTTIRFVAFSNEEAPYFNTAGMGSLRYAGACRAANDKIVGMISLETMGYFSDEPDSQQFPLEALKLIFPSTGNFIAFVSNLKSFGFLKQIAGTFRSLAKFPSEAAALPEQLRGVALSDHMSFWKLGYPALMITDTAPFRYPQYHHAEDTVDKIDYDRLARVVFALSQSLEQLSAGKSQK